MAPPDQHEPQGSQLQLDGLRRTNLLLESANASFALQLQEVTDEHRQPKAEMDDMAHQLQSSTAEVQRITAILAQRDDEVLRIKDVLTREEREHAQTRAILGRLVNDVADIREKRETFEAEREELENERRDLDDEKNDFEGEKEELEIAQAKLEEDQENLGKEQDQLEEDQKQLEEKELELARDQEELGEEMQMWRLRSAALERRVEALISLLEPDDAEAVKEATPVPPAPRSGAYTMKRKAAYGGNVDAYKRARW